MIVSNKKRDNHLRFKYLESIKSLIGFKRDAESFVRFFETYGPEGFKAGRWVAELRSDASQDTLFHIPDKVFTHADFFKSLENRQYAYNLKNYKAYLSKYYLEWEEKVLTEYYLDHLTVFYPVVDMKMREFIYSELIFNVLEKEVWPKADDTNAMFDYFMNNRKKYGVGRKDKDLQSQFKESRSKVRNDFIEYVEKEWTNSLRSNYHIYINEEVVK
jgi:uncharacterized protein YbdZ (MbtH family)